jgi:transposase
MTVCRLTTWRALSSPLWGCWTCAFYACYTTVGGEPLDPQVLLGLLLYGYATGVFSSRKIELATHEVIPFRSIADGLHPDHSTIAWFRKQFLSEIKMVFAQVLLIAHEMGYLRLGNISLDGSKVHADASKNKVVSYGRLLKLEAQLQQEVKELLVLGEQADEMGLPAGLVIETEVALWQERLMNLVEARRFLEARAAERDQDECCILLIDFTQHRRWDAITASSPTDC